MKGDPVDVLVAVGLLIGGLLLGYGIATAAFNNAIESVQVVADEEEEPTHE